MSGPRRALALGGLLILIVAALWSAWPSPAPPVVVLDPTRQEVQSELLAINTAYSSAASLSFRLVIRLFALPDRDHPVETASGEFLRAGGSTWRMLGGVEELSTPTLRLIVNHPERLLVLLPPALAPTLTEMNWLPTTSSSLARCTGVDVQDGDGGQRTMSLDCSAAGMGIMRVRYGRTDHLISRLTAEDGSLLREVEILSLPDREVPGVERYLSSSGASPVGDYASWRVQRLN